MILMAGFLEVLFKALILIGMAFSVGGIIFALAVLHPGRNRSDMDRRAIVGVLRLVLGGAVLVAVCQLMSLLVEPWALADEMGRWPLGAFLETGFARAGLVRAALALCLAALSIGLLKRPFSKAIWAAIIVTAALLMASGAWMVHAISRLEDVLPLAVCTVLHQLGAIMWIGGLAHLTALRRLTHENTWAGEDWPELLTRFSPLAMLSVAILVTTGTYLAFRYIGSLGGFVGTAYGAMVLTKMAMLGSMLLLGAMNFFFIRRWRREFDRREIDSLTPAFAEVEAATGMIIILAASALTSQPPSVDVQAGRATFTEVINTFAPKLPQLTPPVFRDMLAASTSSLDPFSISGVLDRVQSNFNHNIAGLLVLMTGCCAMLDRTGKVRPARHWPLLFLLLGLFLLLFGEPNGWPFGYEGFWETLVSPGVLQHRLATMLVFFLAFFEWRVHVGESPGNHRWRYVFPLLCAAGGALLLTHSHSPFVSKWAYLIEVSHNAIGFLAVLMGIGRWLELRLSPPANRLPGFLWTACMILVGLVLLFYRELPPGR